MFAWDAFILTKQAITSCFVTGKFRKVNCPSHDRVCDDRIRHLHHLRSLCVLSTKVNNMPFWKFEFSQERRYGVNLYVCLDVVTSQATCRYEVCHSSSVCRRRIISLEMVISNTLKWYATAWWVIPAWAIPTARSR
jgi:hypothetical protein